MTIQELIDWLEEERREASYKHSRAQSEFNGNQLWYFNGKLDLIAELLDKLNEHTH